LPAAAALSNRSATNKAGSNPTQANSDIANGIVIGAVLPRSLSPLHRISMRVR